MTEQEMFELLSNCDGSQLDVITVKLKLDPKFLLAPEREPAARAAKIWQRVQQRQAAGMRALHTVLAEMFGEPEPKHENQDDMKAAKGPCVLILAANPIDTDRLRLDREVKLIKERLDEADAGRRFRVEAEWATSPVELSKMLLKYQPSIVHFSGHGSPSGEIVLEGANGKAETVPARALVNLFDTLKGTETIVLNACYSGQQASALAKVVPHVIGMARQIGDDAALRFAAGFYRGLAFGKDYATAYRLGCNEIDLASLPDALVPHFITGADDKVPAQSAVRTTAGATAGSIVPESAALESRPRTWRSASVEKAAPPKDEDAPRLFKLWYGTNRQPLDSADHAKGYSGERDSTVHHGICKVAVPKSHKIGSIGSSLLARLLSWEDDRLKLVELAVLAEADYWQKLHAALAEKDPDERRALVFIHGFNVSFDEAARRAAQIAADLNVPGITAFYSWPSKGSVRGYAADEASIEASEPLVTKFLRRLATESGATRVDVLAHSMGNRALLRSLQNIMQSAQGAKVPFGQLLLAAPDVDASHFRNLAKAYQLAQRTTLYVSSRDKALATSGIIHDYPRAGYTPPVTVVQGIDTVEVSNIDITFLGHGYYAAARDMLHDMHNLIMHGSPPKSRLGLLDVRDADGQRYWQIGA